MVIGSTGLIGTHLIQKLAHEGGFGQIIAICRGANMAGKLGLNNPKVRVLSFDFVNWENLELQVSSFAGGSGISFFCCLGSTIKQAGSEEAFRKVDLDYVVAFAKLAHHCRAEQLLVVSALGADEKSDVFYNRTKGEMEKAVQNEFDGSLYFFRPSLLLGDRKDFRFAERLAILAAPIYIPLLLGPLKKYLPVPAEQVAKKMSLVATKKISVTRFIENEEILKN